MSARHMGVSLYCQRGSSETKSAPSGSGRLKTCLNQRSSEDLLLELFRHHRKLQLGLGEGLDDHALGAFGGGVLGGSHFADKQVLRALEHFLFAEGEGLAAAE